MINIIITLSKTQIIIMQNYNSCAISDTDIAKDNTLIIDDAIRSRITNDLTFAQLTIARFIRTRNNNIKHKFFRRIGLFSATIYLECPELSKASSQILDEESDVKIFGTFSPE